jgi:hypothetical protein
MTGELAARLRRLCSLLTHVLAVLVLSFAISWPLWIFATRDKRAFTLSVGAVFALAFLAFGLRRAWKRIQGRTAASRRADAPRGGS